MSASTTISRRSVHIHGYTSNNSILHHTGMYKMRQRKYLFYLFLSFIDIIRLQYCFLQCVAFHSFISYINVYFTFRYERKSFFDSLFLPSLDMCCFHVHCKYCPSTVFQHHNIREYNALWLDFVCFLVFTNMFNIQISLKRRIQIDHRLYICASVMSQKLNEIVNEIGAWGKKSLGQTARRKISQSAHHHQYTVNFT